MWNKLRLHAGDAFLWALIALGLTGLLTDFNNPVTRQILYNADALYPAMLFRDLVEAGGDAGGWITPPSLQFLPDYLIYFAQALVVPGIGARQLVYASLQYFALVGASLLLVSAAFAGDAKRGLFARRLVLAGAALPVFLAMVVEINQGYLIAFLCAHHLGAWVMTLICATLLLHPRTRYRPGGAALVFPLVCIAIVSDTLFIPLFFPAAVMALPAPSGETRKRRFLFLLLIVLALFAGLRLEAFARKSLPMTMLDYEVAGRLKTALLALTPQTASGGITRAFGHFAREIPWTAWLAAPAILAITGAGLLRGIRFPMTAAGRDHRAVFVFLTVSVAANILALAATTTLIDFFATRYLPALYFAYMPALGLAAIFFKESKEGDSLSPTTRSPGRARFYRAFAPITIISVLVLFMATRSVPGPPLVRCLENRAGEPLTVGYGIYWHASPVNLYSEKGPRLLQTGATLRPYFRANSFQWYVQSPPPDFIVADQLDENFIRERFGEPARVLRCGASRVFLFNKEQKEKLRAHHARMITDIGLWRIVTGR